MAAKGYMVMTYDDGRPTEVITPDGRLGLLFPRAEDDGVEIFYGHPELNKAIFRVHPDGKETFIVGGMTVDEVRDQVIANGSLNWEPGCEDWELVERVTVTFW
jgi:hypothetical protein